ncbi:NAD-aldehyde dehydrogenase [Exidia glandulosa HHB12029]|uniref:Aldehyde dehydrogenase n=1 Tax=Exidia glandulosa HHB12029 TaxID=1314781 RepID=A0A165QHC6_EXIGL|nr:NAD-aldehyde dehydrogenase [Exidia glandulosa HHB12029]
MATYQATPVADIASIRDGLFAAYATGKTKDIAFRKEQLLQVAYMFQDNKQRFRDALAQDLARPPNETDFLEFVAIMEQSLKAYENVHKWAKPDSPAFSINTFPMRPRVYKEPKGVALIIGPFNYPLFCVFTPFIGAMAAGCAAAIKPSEMTPATAALVTELMPKYLDSRFYTVINGAVPETTALLDLQWDHIFFTGGGRVAKVVATAAAKYLTPTTLELGGKNPTIVDKDIDFDASARRILWGKTANAGQSCTAPDYIMVVGREAHDKLIAGFEKAYKTFYPNPDTQVDEMTHVVNAASFQRITGLLERTKGKIVLGGKTDASKNWISTTIVDGCSFDDALLESEVFGPVLSVVTVDSIEQAVAHVRKGDNPLGCYIFTRSQKNADYVRMNTTSGTFMVNETVIQAGIYGIPFGGIGPSGSGYSNGKYAFDTFTHLRGSLHLPGWMEKMMAFRYPPHTPKKLSQMKMLMRTIPYARPGSKPATPWGKLFASLAVVVGIVAAYRHKSK